MLRWLAFKLLALLVGVPWSRRERELVRPAQRAGWWELRLAWVLAFLWKALTCTVPEAAWAPSAGEMPALAQRQSAQSAMTGRR